MSKRVTNTTANIAIGIMLLLQPLTAYAYTAEELYEDCEVEWESPYSQEDLDTIRNYNYAKRYASMFRYVADSTYDESVIEERIQQCEEQLQSIEKELLAGFDKTEVEIYQLESDYNTALQQLEEAKSTMTPIDVDVKKLSADEIPTYAEYVKALNRKRSTEVSCNLGEMKAVKASLNAVLIKDYTSTSVTYATVEGSGVVSLFNGVVAAVGEDHVTINHHNGIVSSYKGLRATVKVGDTVTQGSPIGITPGEFTVKLRVGDKLIDIYKLLEVSDEEVQN